MMAEPLLQGRTLDLDGVVLYEPRIFSDDRGSFVEFWRESSMREHFVQDNIAVSRRGVLRGLHFQHPNPQGKFVSAAFGTIYDVVVDIRNARWLAVELSAEKGNALYIPPGYAHGYQVLSDHASVIYKCTEYYNGQNDRAIVWNDPDLAITWPIANPVLSAKDASAKPLRVVRAECGF